LRAGVLPRLKRDDAHFVCLAPIRPERAALTGENGLIGALEKAFPDRARAALREAIDSGAVALRKLLAELVKEALARTLAAEDSRKPPALVLAIDQAEELFRAEGSQESAALLALLRDLVTSDDPAVIVIFAIRSDAYDRLEHAPALEGLAQSALPLLPLPRGNYRNVIEGPASRAVEAGQNLAVEPIGPRRARPGLIEGNLRWRRERRASCHCAGCQLAAADRKRPRLRWLNNSNRWRRRAIFACGRVVVNLYRLLRGCLEARIVRRRRCLSEARHWI
jgi:hypothetical protein